jgi:hypothetical protein
MTDIDDEGFLKKYHIESPELSTLGVIHAESVTLCKGEGYTFSGFARNLIRDLISELDETVDQFLKKIASCTYAQNQKIIFFLDGPYVMAEHLWAVRSSIEDIAMVSCTVLPPYDFAPPPPVGGLFVADVPTLMDLASRSPFLGQLLTIADGPPDDFIWVYFLGKFNSKEEATREGIEMPVKCSEPIAK